MSEFLAWRANLKAAVAAAAAAAGEVERLLRNPANPAGDGGPRELLKLLADAGLPPHALVPGLDPAPNDPEGRLLGALARAEATCRAAARQLLDAAGTGLAAGPGSPDIIRAAALGGDWVVIPDELERRGPQAACRADALSSAQREKIPDRWAWRGVGWVILGPAVGTVLKQEWMPRQWYSTASAAALTARWAENQRAGREAEERRRLRDNEDIAAARRREEERDPAKRLGRAEEALRQLGGLAPAPPAGAKGFTPEGR